MFLPASFLWNIVGDEVAAVSAMGGRRCALPLHPSPAFYFHSACAPLYLLGDRKSTYQNKTFRNFPSLFLAAMSLHRSSLVVTHTGHDLVLFWSYEFLLDPFLIFLMPHSGRNTLQGLMASEKNVFDPNNVFSFDPFTFCGWLHFVFSLYIYSNELWHASFGMVVASWPVS